MIAPGSRREPVGGHRVAVRARLARGAARGLPTVPRLPVRGDRAGVLSPDRPGGVLGLSGRFRLGPSPRADGAAFRTGPRVCA